MACAFDPRLPGFKMLTLADTRRLADTGPGPLPGNPEVDHTIKSWDRTASR